MKSNALHTHPTYREVLDRFVIPQEYFFKFLVE